jgi:hypothetical protein
MKKGENLKFCPICRKPITKDIAGKPIDFVKPEWDKDNLLRELYFINCDKCEKFAIDYYAIYELENKYYEQTYKDKLDEERENKLINKAIELYKDFNKEYLEKPNKTFKDYAITPEILKEVFGF